jgi:feruloyl esterase
MKKHRTSVVAFAVMTAAIGARIAAQTGTADACARLSAQQLPATTIGTAQAVTAGSFTVPGTTNTLSGLPPFCRVSGTIAPTNQSQILFEVWLPLEKWNGKLAGVGNGGWAGTISWGPLAEQLRRGYATASTNTGHEAAPGANAAKFAFDKPEQLVDFASRSHHETALKAKALVEAFYGKPAERAYFVGCSSGGYEGLMEAQRFPADYDGIVAGAPANNFTRLMAGDFEATLAVFKNSVNNLPPSALGVLHRAVLSACDAKDGVVDGVLDDPPQCTFDPSTIACKAGQPPDTCLSAEQIEAARRIYTGIKDPTSGALLYPGLAKGSEPFWPNRDIANPFPIPVSYFKWLVFADPNWDWKSFSFDRPADFAAYQKAEDTFAPILNATSPDLSAFRQRGGKLLQYHGWNDQLISAQNSIDYYESVVAKMGGGRPRAQALQDTQSFYRLFMAPGMGHCSGGTGPNTFDMQSVLAQWVEKGTAPEQVVATRSTGGVVDRLRPLCVYPKTAVYSGKGDTNEASSFACRERSER